MIGMARPGTKPMIDERDFVPRSIDEARALYGSLVRSGTSVSQARGVVSWLIVLPEQRSDDPASDMVRRDYRRALLPLGEPPWGKVG
jgi:hypothetical protein